MRGIQELSERSTATIQEPLRVRIGLHTGVAVIGKAGRDHVHDATEIVGETPNIAFRLQEQGEPNSLVISGETKRLLRGKFPLRPLGMRALKGLSRKIEVFLVLGEALEDDAAHRARHRNALPMVNRVAEIGQLQQAWELAKTGRGQTVEIAGEPGIGKSRLALELIDKTGLPDDLILAIQASAQHQNTPLYPIIRTLEQRIGIRKDEGAEANSARLREFLATTSAGDEEQYMLIGQMLGLPTVRHTERDGSRRAGAASEDARCGCAAVDVARPRRREPDIGRGFSLDRSIDDRDRRARRWTDRQRADSPCDHQPGDYHSQQLANDPAHRASAP